MKLYWICLTLLALILSACQATATATQTATLPPSQTAFPSPLSPTSSVFTQIPESLDTPVILTRAPTTTILPSAESTQPTTGTLLYSITASSGKPTLCLVFEPTPISTPLPWINDKGYWENIATSRLPIQSSECTAPNDIVYRLVYQWLDTIKVNSLHLPCGLEDYKVGTITIKPNTITLQYDIVAIVDYEVNLGRFSDCGWIPDRGILAGNGWIKTHDPFGVYRQNGYYQLVVLPGWGT